MDLVNEICDAALHDYFFSLESGNTIFLHTVDRSTEPQLNRITQFINATDGAIAKEVGIELRNEVCSKLLVGGQVEQIYFQPRWLLEDQENPEANYDEGYTEALNTIWPFWGFNADGTAILGKGKFETNGPTLEELPTFNPDRDEHHFEVDSRLIDVPGVGETYDIRLLELRAALMGQETWEAYMWFKKPDLATQIGMVNGPKAFIEWFDRVMADEDSLLAARAIDSTKFAPLFGHMLVTRSGNPADVADEKIKMLYEFVLNIAENYGRTFMVRIPDISIAVEPETNLIRTNLRPVSDGYFAEEIWNHAIGRNLAPTLIERLTTPEGKIQAYVKFANSGSLKLERISEEDIILSTDGQTLFLKCQVSPEIVYLQHPTGNEDSDDDPFGNDDNSGVFSPRAVITLPGPIRSFEEDCGPMGLLKILISESFHELVGATETTETAVHNLLEHFMTMPGGDGAMFGTEAICYIPNMVALPILNTQLRYGPWYAVGADGLSEVEIAEDLVPWNYGGFTVMNAVAQSRVAEATANGQLAESGSVEVAGAPQISIGGQLISGGPYITDINVNVGVDGVTTLYRMETWTRRFGKWAKSNEERLGRFGRLAREARRQNRIASSIPEVGSKYYKLRERVALPSRYTHRSSAMFVASHIFEKDTNDEVTSTAFIPDYYANNFLSNRYQYKALMSLDGLFRPFSTNSGLIGTMSKFETPTISGSVQNGIITNQELNPFKEGHHINVITHGNTIPAKGTLLQDNIDYNNQRGVGLRGPLIVTGWGIDTNGYAFPAEAVSFESDGDEVGYEFRSDYQTYEEAWKTGPVDLRWDRERKVWMGESRKKVGIAVASIGSSLTGDSTIVPIRFNMRSHNIHGIPYSAGGVLGQYLYAKTGKYRISICINCYATLSANRSVKFIITLNPEGGTTGPLPGRDISSGYGAVTYHSFETTLTSPSTVASNTFSSTISATTIVQMETGYGLGLNIRSDRLDTQVGGIAGGIDNSYSQVLIEEVFV
jgi:hypothetical protein